MSAPSILIVDDDQGLLHLIGQALKRAGLATATAASGKDAVAWLSTHRADLMLLDLKLQDIEGKELISRLEEMGCAVPFIVITGQGDERVAVEIMKRGALDYLVKDASFLQFVPEVVQRALSQVEREKRLAAAEQALRQSEAERKDLEKALLEISEREQRRIGHDLHDGLGQHLAGTELMSQVLEEKLKSKNLKTEASRAGDIARHVREAISQARMLARGLSPVVLESAGLMSALQELALGAEQVSRIRCQFECKPPVLVEDHTVATHLFRIAQEALSNAIKHGKSKEVSIRLQATGEKIILTVQDRGVGLPKTLPDKRGMGLRIMEYRAAMIGGNLSVQREPEGGTSVICSVQARAPAANGKPS